MEQKTQPNNNQENIPQTRSQSQQAEESKRQRNTDVDVKPLGNSKMEDAPETEEELLPSWDEFQVGQPIDILDSTQKWSEGEICEVHEATVRVHYLYWGKKWDETLARDSDRLAPCGSKAYVEGGVLRVGQRIEVLDLHPNNTKWCEAWVVEEQKQQVKVHYKGFTAKWDAWLSRRSRRICPFGRHLRANTPDARRKNAQLRIERQSSEGGYEQRDRRRVIGRTDPRFERYCSALAQRGMRVVEVEGDGNCLFRSVSHQLYGTEECHMMIRQKCMDYMMVYKETFEAFVEGDMADFMDYVQHRRQNHVWGDHLEIQAMCELYGRPAHIYAYSAANGGGAEVVQTLHQAAPGAPSLHLSYYGRGHYDSVVGPNFKAWVVNTQPGQLEDQKLAEARDRRQRFSHHMAAAGGVGAAMGGEDAAMDAALRASREAFDRAVGGDLEAALMQSFATHAADDDMKRAQQLSMQSLQQDDNRITQSALHHTAAALAGAALLPPTAAGDPMAAALAASAADAAAAAAAASTPAPASAPTSPGGVDQFVAASMGMWTCGGCTSLNPFASAACAVCATPKPDAVVAAQLQAGERFWRCAACTMENDATASRCHVCDAVRADATTIAIQQSALQQMRAQEEADMLEAATQASLAAMYQ